MKGRYNMQFKNGELIVRDDTRHPEGTLVVDCHDHNGNLRAYPLGGGLDLTIPAGDVARFSVVTKDEATPIYRKARFSLEGLDDAEFEGWTADKRWNGWAMPCFEIQQATKLAGSLENQLRYDPAQDAFIGSSGDEEETWSGHLIDLPDGGQTKVYAIGAGSWMWDLVEEGGGVWA
jgi:hypothetical protein